MDQDTQQLTEPPHLTIITGPYGVGKTNLSLNIARALRERYPKVTLIDLDIVNPYFCSSNSADYLHYLDIRLLGPVHGDSNLDTPSLSPGIDTAIELAGSAHAVLIDVGGDPDGARALARFADAVKQRPFKTPYRMVYILNLNRVGADTISGNLELLHSIEDTSGLTVTHILGNTHLKAETTVQTILDSIPPTVGFARRADLPLMGITAPRSLEPEVEAANDADPDPVIAAIRVFPVDIIVGTNWEV